LVARHMEPGYPHGLRRGGARGASQRPITQPQRCTSSTRRCGYPYLAKLNTDGTTTPVSVPNVDEHSSVVVLGSHHGHLDLHPTVPCGTGQSLLSYDPVANMSTVLLGPPVNGGGVVAVVSYPGQE
jgi:hypothetical protein